MRRTKVSEKKMIFYLCDLMEDTNDFLWANAKASHAVLLCEIERGTVDWSNTPRIDRIRRAHAQCHTTGNNQSRVRNQDPQHKPWFCKAYQIGSCQYTTDHDLSGKTHKHICAFCLTQGRHMNHPEKDCYFAKNTEIQKTSSKLLSKGSTWQQQHQSK